MSGELILVRPAAPPAPRPRYPSRLEVREDLCGAIEIRVNDRCEYYFQPQEATIVAAQLMHPMLCNPRLLHGSC